MRGSSGRLARKALQFFRSVRSPGVRPKLVRMISLNSSTFSGSGWGWTRKIPATLFSPSSTPTAEFAASMHSSTNCSDSLGTLETMPRILLSVSLHSTRTSGRSSSMNPSASLRNFRILRVTSSSSVSSDFNAADQSSGARPWSRNV
ncbi:hypothetical protein SDC9_187525 [bioreactor metagenome]|uniref:Uncharacterized protein n=1 Tax=bioreactor metagenome TaxID=1076179 RepID=A0A645HME8_9ZZZZ